MLWLDAWWRDEVVDGYKGPLLVSFVPFVVTFVATRTITRLIRAGRGRFTGPSSAEAWPFAAGREPIPFLRPAERAACWSVGRFCCSIYCLMMVRGAPPQEAAK
jgi:hypothetical protein